MPAGCLLEYSDDQLSETASLDAAVADAASPVQAASPGVHSIRGNKTAEMANHSAAAPFLRTTFGNATKASATRVAMLDSPSVERHGLAKMLCKPIGTKEDIKRHKDDIIFWSLFFGIPATIILIIIVANVISHCCCKKQDQVQT